MPLDASGGWRSAIAASADARRLADGRFDAAVLLPNSFAAALLARRARIAERWGYRRDFRGRLLTRAIDPPQTVDAPRGVLSGARRGARRVAGSPPVASLRVDQALRDRATALLTDAGWRGEPIVAFAPGAAFGTAKRWPPDRVGAVAASLARDRGAVPVLVGARRRRCNGSMCTRCVHIRYARSLSTADDRPHRPHGLCRRWPPCSRCRRRSCRTIRGPCTWRRPLVSPVVALFGPTNERRTSPLADREGAPRAIVAGDAWCRPCELRRCPLDHRCMRSISVERVAAEANGS